MTPVCQRGPARCLRLAHNAATILGIRVAKQRVASPQDDGYHPFVRFMNSPKSGTVNAVSPWAGL